MTYDSLYDSFNSVQTIVQQDEEITEEKKKPIKRPHNAYNLFFIERQPIERENHPKLSGNEISQLIGRQWNEMSAEERYPYREKADILHQKFKQQYPDYHYQKSTEKTKKKRKSKKNSFMIQEAPNQLHFIDENNDALAMNTNNNMTNQQEPEQLDTKLKSFFSAIGLQMAIKFSMNHPEELNDFLLVMKGLKAFDD